MSQASISGRSISESDDGSVGIATEANPVSVDQEEEQFPTDSDERILRRMFHKHLQQSNKLRKYETRFQQAVFRNDKALEKSSKADWESFTANLLQDPNSVLSYQPPTTRALSSSPPSLARQRDTNSTQFSSVCCQLNQASIFRHLHPFLRSMEERDTKRVREGSASLLKFREKLVRSILLSRPAKEDENFQNRHPNTNPSSDSIQPSTITTSKERQTLRAAELKANMQRGTQTKAMFEDELALLGYTRQKFHERAVLTFSSLDRLDLSYCDDEKRRGTEDACEDAETRPKKEMQGSTTSIPEKPIEERIADTNWALMACIWHRLMSTEQIVSIGCGPGCDAMGALAFLESHGVNLSNGIVLLDYVIDAWKDLVLERLVPMIVPHRIPFVRTVVCDVRESLLDEPGDKSSSPVTNTDNNGAARIELTTASERHHRLVVVSYLLTETREKWKVFFGNLLGLLKGTESLLLLTEPTAWQLHEFLRCFGSSNSSSSNTSSDRVDNDLLIKAHVWLDSSRDLPHLQDLDKRNGPAILLVCTT